MQRVYGAVGGHRSTRRNHRLRRHQTTEQRPLAAPGLPAEPVTVQLIEIETLEQSL